MNRDARESFDSAAAMLVNMTGCQRSVAAQFVELVALGTIRWNKEVEEGLTGGNASAATRAVRNKELFDAWQAGYREGEKSQ